MLIYVAFPNSAQDTMTTLVRDTIPGEFESLLRYQSRGAYYAEVSVLLDPRDETNKKMWVADYPSHYYRAPGTCFPSRYDSCWTGTGGLINGVDTSRFGELEAEIFAQVQTAYDTVYGAGQYTSPFANADFIAFMFIPGGKESADCPDQSESGDVFGGGIGGAAFLNVRTNCVRILEDAPSTGSVVYGLAQEFYHIQDKRPILWTLLHELGHKLFPPGTYSHAPGSDVMASTWPYYHYTSLNYSYGGYSVMRAVRSDESPEHPTFSNWERQILGWLPPPAVVTKDTVGYDLRELEASGNRIRVLIDARYAPCSGGAVRSWRRQYLELALESGEDPLYGKPSRGISVWHVMTEADTLVGVFGGAESDVAYDLETTLGRFSDPSADLESATCWRSPDPVDGWSAMEYFDDCETEAPRNQGEYNDYFGSSDDFINLATNGFDTLAFWTNPSTFAYDEEPCLGVLNFIRDAPQSTGNSIVIRIASQTDSVAVLDILFHPERLTAPLSSSLYAVGDTVRVQWNHDYTEINAVDILFSRDGGAGYRSVAAGIVNTGEYLFVPQFEDISTEGVVKVVYHNTKSSATYADSTGAILRIIPLPSVAVTYENESSNTGALASMAGSPIGASPFFLGEDGVGSGDDPDLMIALSGYAAALHELDHVPSSGVPYFDRYEFAAGEDPPTDVRSVVGLDLNNDGYRDVVMVHADSLVVYLNNGGALAAATGMFLSGQMAYGASAAAADYDGDGRLDLFVSRDVLQEPPPWVVFEQFSEECSPGFIYHNVGGHGLQRIHPGEMGLMTGACAGSRSVLWLDVDGDQDQDLFIANYRDGASRIFIYDDATGSFAEGNSQWFSGCTGLSRVTGAARFDFNGDGMPDLALSKSVAPGLMILQNTGQAFEAVDLGAVGVSLPDTAFAALSVLDFDGNGRHDLLLMPSEAGASVRLLGNYSGAISALRDYSDRSGIDEGSALGAVLQDYDDDGLVDLYLCRPSGSGNFYYHQTVIAGKAAPHWLGVELEGSGVTSYDAVGAKVVVGGSEGPITRWLEGGGSGRSCQASPTLYFGLGDSTAAPGSIRVIWPDGREKVVTSPTLDAVTVIRDDADFEIVSTSVQMTTDLSPGQTDWIFEWDTDALTVASQDTVWITNETCQCGASGALTATSPGVTYEITENGGIYHHRLLWSEGCCIPNCQVTYHVTSGTRFHVHSSGTKIKTIKTCLSQ